MLTMRLTTRGERGSGHDEVQGQTRNEGIGVGGYQGVYFPPLLDLIKSLSQILVCVGERLVRRACASTRQGERRSFAHNGHNSTLLLLMLVLRSLMPDVSGEAALDP